MTYFLGINTLLLGHDKGADYWSLGVMIHEMICGITPFNDYGTDQMTLFRAIVNGKIKISNMGKNATDLIRRIVVTKPSVRLGNLAGADMDIKDHPYFKGVDFDRIIEKKPDCILGQKNAVPFTPKLKNVLDVSSFENWDHMAADSREKALTDKELRKFSGFDKICSE